MRGTRRSGGLSSAARCWGMMLWLGTGAVVSGAPTTRPLTPTTGPGPSEKAVAQATTQPTTAPALDPAVEAELVEQLQRYFSTPDAAGRRRILGTISRRPEADVPTVGRLLRKVALWKPVEPGMQVFSLEAGLEPPTRVHVRVPADYDPRRAYPLILALHGTGQNAVHFVHYLEGVLGPAAEDYLIVAPQNYRGTWFLVTEQEAAEPVRLLEALRHRYHVDTDRVYVTGYSMGGHAAFMLAVLYTDWFAAAVPLAGTFTTPNTPETKAILLPNLRGFPMLLVWGARDTHDRNDHDTRTGGIAGLNRLLRAELPEMDVRQVEFIELPERGHREVVPPRERLLHYLKMTRPHDLKEIVHWFRFPAQGRRGWLRLREFAGEPWEGQIVVKVRPGADVHAYARRAVRRKLAFLEGRIEGQTVRLRFQHGRRVELLLHDGLLDLHRPVTIYRGKKVVFEGALVPRLSTLLETAYADWEFQRLAGVRVMVPLRGKGRQE